MSSSIVPVFLLRYDSWWIVCLVISPNIAIFPESLRMRMPVIIIEASPTHASTSSQPKMPFLVSDKQTNAYRCWNYASYVSDAQARQISCTECSD